MWQLNLYYLDGTEIGVYASFNTYPEALDYGKRHQYEFITCGYYYTVTPADQG